MGLFFTVNSVWASKDNNKQDKTSAKKESVEKKADAPKSTVTACCAEKKDSCNSKGNCADKKTGSNAASCTNKIAAAEIKSSGKKAN
jgi:hypothetical protein